jgi:hypothetical protein
VGWAGVVVFCRGIERLNLGIIGAQHCDARVSNGDGKVYSISGGYDQDNRADMWGVPASDSVTGDVYYSQYQPATPALSSFANCLVNAANAIHTQSGRAPYNAVKGPNSNTGLNQVFASCGVSLGLKTHGTRY